MIRKPSEPKGKGLESKSYEPYVHTDFPIGFEVGEVDTFQNLNLRALEVVRELT